MKTTVERERTEKKIDILGDRFTNALAMFNAIKERPGPVEDIAMDYVLAKARAELIGERLCRAAGELEAMIKR